MTGLELVALGVLMTAALTSRKSGGRRSPSPDVLELIRREAALAGVPLQVALAFARVESNFNPLAEGDLDWPKKKPAAYRVLVTEGRPSNPYARDASRWHSYGLFQLHAAHHVKGDEDPRVLLDPRINTARAMAALAKLLHKAGGDPIEARYLYVGCGEGGANCAASYRAQVRAKIERALTEFQGAS